jgi:hypothetical protein
MDSSKFDDYAGFVARIRDEASVGPLLEALFPRFPLQEQLSFFKGLQRFGLHGLQETIFDLVKNGLSEFIQDQLLNNPFRLIESMYSNLRLQERLGQRLHSLLAEIANRYDMDFLEIQKHVVLTLCDPRAADPDCSPAMVDGGENLQLAFFIVLTWIPSQAIGILKKMATTPHTTYYQKSVAVTLLSFFLPHDFGDQDFYVRATFEALGIDPEADIRSVDAGEADPQLASALLLHCIDNRISDESFVLPVLRRLRDTHPRFLLTHMWQLFERMPIWSSDEVFEIYRVLVSRILWDVMVNSTSKRSRMNQASPLRDAFVAISVSPRPIDYLVIDGTPWSWGRFACSLCNAGQSVLAAELGGHLPCLPHRRAVLFHVLQEGHYDDALHFGLGIDDIFHFLATQCLESATQTLMDQNFVLFTRWLKAKGLKDSIAQVEQALQKQGRTVELKRMRERLELVGTVPST